MADTEVWTPSFRIDEPVGRRERKPLEVPTEFEARCYLMSRQKGQLQSKIAGSLGVTQGTVSRAVRVAEAKIDRLKRSGRFDADAIDQVLARLTAGEPVRRRA